MGFVDIAVFFAFIATVLFIALRKSRVAKGRERDTQDYFLAGRGLHWWLIGFSLIAANISTEQFVGMSGNAASHVGLAIASYEWMAAITLVIIAFAFLPYFLRAGIYTMPEFLEYRYDHRARALMAAATVLIYLLLLGAVTYSGALTLRTLFGEMGYDVGLYAGSFFIALVAMIYVVSGGLKASVWADLVQGSGLILGGALVMWFAFTMLGSVDQAATVVDVSTGEVAVRQLDPAAGPLERFFDLNSSRLNMFLPKTDTVLPWTALLLGLWIPNFYYWGLNQYITQRTLGSASLAQGQRGIVFAAYLKLLIPFVVVIPGIIAFNLFWGDMQLKARPDVAKAMGLYVKSNSETELVKVLEEPEPELLSEFSGPGYLIALFDSAEEMAQHAVPNARVLPMLRSEFDALQPARFQLFDAREDHAWRHVNPELAREIEAYNARVEAAARASGGIPSTQALIAFKYDTAFGLLLGSVVPRGVGVLGFVLAALLGAVVSSLAAMLNAASTIFTMDLWNRYVRPGAPQAHLVLLGRTAVVFFAVIAFLLAPQLGNPNISNSIFTIIQESQGFISPGVLAVFALGLLVRRAPRSAGLAGLVTSIVAYGVLKFAVPSLQFLNRMAVTFGLAILVILLLRIMRPLPRNVDFDVRTQMELTTSQGAKTAGLICILLTLLLYVIFSPLVLAR
ncbi:MAG TPA: sodium/solute symporter [Acidobacteriota bacterium]|nr:sodium/solute symporter [Acidobacteriota bacterium]